MKFYLFLFITLLSLIINGCENRTLKDEQVDNSSPLLEESLPGAGDTVWTVADEITVPAGTTVIRIDPSTLPLMLFTTIQPQIGPNAVMMEVQPFSQGWGRTTPVPFYFKFGSNISHITINDTIRIENMGEAKYFQRIPLVTLDKFNSYPVHLYGKDGKTAREYFEITMQRIVSSDDGINVENSIDINVTVEE